MVYNLCLMCFKAIILSSLKRTKSLKVSKRSTQTFLLFEAWKLCTIIAGEGPSLTVLISLFRPHQSAHELKPLELFVRVPARS